MNFNIVVSNMIKNLKYDREIQDAIKGLYGKTYKVNLKDNITNEQLEELNREERKKTHHLLKKHLQRVIISYKIMILRQIIQEKRIIHFLF